MLRLTKVAVGVDVAGYFRRRFGDEEDEELQTNADGFFSVFSIFIIIRQSEYICCPCLSAVHFYIKQVISISSYFMIFSGLV